MINAIYVGLIFLVLSYPAYIQFEFASAQNRFQSGYDHGCSDGQIPIYHKRYLNQPQKGPEFHTTDFMKGYTQGFAECYTGFYSCYDQGYLSGMNSPFSSAAYDRCGSYYYDGFIFGCISVPGNTREACERSTDS